MTAKHSYAYVQHLRIPNEFAFGLYIVKMCEAAQSLGYPTTLVIPKRAQPAHFPHQDLWKYYQVPKNLFRVKHLPVPELLHLPPMFEAIYKPLRYQVSTWTFFFQALWYLSNQKIQIIETIDREIICLLRLCWWYRPLVIYDVHDEAETWLEKTLDRFLIPRVNLFMVNCLYFKDYYSKRSRPDQQLIVLANGFDPDHYHVELSPTQLRKKLELPSKRYILGFIGRFDTMGVEKGVREMIQAAAMLKSELPITVIAVGGPEKLLKEYQTLADELGLTRQEVILRAQVKPELVGQYIQSFDVAGMLYPDVPHYRDRMSPMKAIEYMAGQRPILATDLPSIRQLVNDNRGYLIPPIKVDAIAKTLLHIYKHPKEAESKAKKAQEFVQQYTWINRQAQIFKAIED